MGPPRRGRRRPLRRHQRRHKGIHRVNGASCQKGSHSRKWWEKNRKRGGRNRKLPEPDPESRKGRSRKWRRDRKYGGKEAEAVLKKEGRRKRAELRCCRGNEERCGERGGCGANGRGMGGGHREL